MDAFPFALKGQVEFLNSPSNSNHFLLDVSIICMVTLFWDYKSESLVTKLKILPNQNFILDFFPNYKISFRKEDTTWKLVCIP